MGGMGSGSYYRWNSKQTVEDGLTLDLNKLIRDGSIKPGLAWQGTLVWTNTRTGEQVASIGYVADLMDPDNAHIRLHYNHNDKPQNYSVPLTTTRPNFGGVRWWFICPVSGQRVGKLHSPPGQPLFASSKVLNLAYHSQREHKFQRLLNRAYKLRERIDRKAAVYCEAPIPKKPKGMHSKTYESLRAEIFRLEREALAAMSFSF
ncbi:hypothetical protein [Terasakiella pusilla]|uniref:hypothetical protein n=1 Tax=Terasakiella pusilla TaxID=64973 RepID=UPI003AA99733